MAPERSLCAPARTPIVNNDADTSQSFILAPLSTFSWTSRRRPHLRRAQYAYRRLLADQVLGVLFVVETVVIQQLCIEQDGLVQFNAPGSCIRLRVVDGHVDFKASVIHAPKPLGHLRSVSHWTSLAIEPNPVSEAVGFDHERVALPFPRRIPVPRGLRV